jgi:hypothetical protein
MLSAGDSLSWSADGSVNSGGFKICAGESEAPRGVGRFHIFDSWDLCAWCWKSRVNNSQNLLKQKGWGVGPEAELFVDEFIHEFRQLVINS